MEGAHPNSQARHHLTDVHDLACSRCRHQAWLGATRQNMEAQGQGRENGSAAAHRLPRLRQRRAEAEGQRNDPDAKYGRLYKKTCNMHYRFACSKRKSIFSVKFRLFRTRLNHINVRRIYGSCQHANKDVFRPKRRLRWLLLLHNYHCSGVAMRPVHRTKFASLRIGPAERVPSVRGKRVRRGAASHAT